MKTKIFLNSALLFLFVGLIIISVTGCDREETIEVKPIFETEEESTNELDEYLKSSFRDPYGTNIIYKFVDNFVDSRFKVTPPKLEVVKPTLELVKKLWIAPYNVASDKGEDFLQTYFPAEIVLLGAPIVNADGSQTLGIAEGGVRVTLTNINNYDPNDEEWIIKTLRFAHHEFAHMIDQNFNFDVEAFFNISKEGYTSPNSWIELTQDEAIARGMVTNYGTSAVTEDFAELVSMIIVTDPDEFNTKFLAQEDCTGQGQNCLDKNEGRKIIQQKYDAVVKYLDEDVGIDLLKVRDEFLKNKN
ncbi:substrate import-associated zinc metallohydrolase lipoprotein [Aquimarina sp. 2201CG1-2-11]|uniref:substrate import-associated zinc metallohydrolase lipoprotein n=1 Tax=Aquimarina discodermiae TaxID=3231043 RepID=UPI003463415C